ncbi:trafficking protein particle complex subunit 10 [Mytilus galloprovincialis]|nr:trafficking protein particle complex subunit 10 [Mytilus galloprovincialis]
MRLMRERRNEPGWGFIQFFLIQEELAFMFEMLGLYDDAMIQYDELDALFSQFVITKVSGTAVPWLTNNFLECKSWAGISLQKAINRDRRDQIKDNKASLIEFRNYLFSRQCALLFLLGKPSEVSRRAMEFLYNTVLEVIKLKISVIPGALDCWSFVSALEVLQTCEKYEDLYNPELFYLYRATLWDHARKKLYSLGELCGLMPEDDVQPRSEQLTMVLDLTSGMGIAEENDAVNVNNQPRPRDKLREALSSKDSFQKIYLELLEQAMGTFKHIGRYRCARLITKDLALFYMRMGHPEKAENYLSEAVKSYHQEGWSQLSEGTRLDLARCQDKLKNKHKYPFTALYIASSSTLPEADRRKYLERLYEEAKNSTETSPLKASPLITVEEMSFTKPEVYINHVVEVELKIKNKGPCDVSCDQICLSFTQVKSSQNTKPVVSRQASDTSLTENVANCRPISKPTANMIPLQENIEGSLKSPVLCGVSCFQSKDLLRRVDSAGSKTITKQPAVKKEDYALCISGQDIILKPGENVIVLSKKIEKVGVFRTNQFWVKIGNLDLIKTLDVQTSFTSSYHQPLCQINPTCRDKLIMGIENEVELSIENSNLNLETGQQLEVVTSSDLQVKTSDGSRFLTIDESTKDKSLKFNFTLYHDIIESESIDFMIKIACDRFPQPLLTGVTFVSPLLASHKVHTANKRKYLQIALEGHSDSSFTLQDPTASTTNKDVEFICLSKPDQKWNVYKSQRVSYLWELKCNTESVMSLPVFFHVNYICSLEQKQRTFSYTCQIDNFRTQYHVRVTVTPQGENKHCQMSVLSCMKIEVTSMYSNYTEDRVLYRVDDDSFWAVSGKSAGLLNIANGHGSIEIDVMAITAGHLPLPRVTLCQYKENTEIVKQESVDSEPPPSPLPQKTVQDNLLPFQQGQVYYASIAKQVHVYPNSINSHMEAVIDNKLTDVKI